MRLQQSGGPHVETYTTGVYGRVLDELAKGKAEVKNRTTDEQLLIREQ